MENETKQEMEKVETPENNKVSVPVETAEPQVDKNAPAPKLNIDKFSPRQLMELDACTRCGECSNWCPAYDQDDREPLNPRGRAGLFKDIIGRQYGVFSADSILGKLFGKKPVTNAEMEAFAKDLYACSTCMQCHFVCPVAIDTVELWERIRETIVDAGHGPLDDQKALVKNTKSYDNPWAQPRSSRGRWAKMAKKKKRINDVPKDISKKSAEVLYYVGCTASYDNNVEEVAINSTKIFERAGVDFGILGNKEKCCGSVLLRMGARASFEKICGENIEQFNGLGIKTLVTSCAGCLKTIKEDYKRVGKLDFEIKHTLEYIVDLIKAGKLKLEKPVDLKITYHDPCHLGRHAGIFDAPRELISLIPGLELVEMERNRENSRCCGAGGGLKAGFPDMQNSISQKRIDDALETGATELVSACPFCYQGLQVGIQAKDANINMRDITELVCMALADDEEEKKSDSKPASDAE